MLYFDKEKKTRGPEETSLKQTMYRAKNKPYSLCSIAYALSLYVLIMNYNPTVQHVCEITFQSASTACVIINSVWMYQGPDNGLVYLHVKL